MTNPETTQFNKLVGVVGGAASGKDTVAEIFHANGYQHVSSSDLLREEIASRGLTTSRELQTQVANEMRQKHGLGYWVDLSVSKLDKAGDAVVSGLYSEGEGQHLVQKYGGLIVGVVVGEGDDSRVRYERLQRRASGARDHISYEEFMAAHNRENGGASPAETNIQALLNMARFTIVNSADLAHLEEQTMDVIAQLKGDA